MHTHAYTEIFYVIGGAGQFKIEALVYPVEKDDMVIVNSNIAHTELGRGDSPLEYIVLGIEGLEFAAASEERFFLANFRKERENVLFYLRNMLQELENKEDGYATLCQDLLEILLILLSRNVGFSARPDKQAAKTLKNCANVRRYIEGHFKENITLEQLARMAHFSKYHMAHSFSRQYGISPINYLIRRRIEESKHLLRDTNHSMSEISSMLGFSSPSYFSQSFKKLVGLSPMGYRKGSGA